MASLKALLAFLKVRTAFPPAGAGAGGRCGSRPAWAYRMYWILRFPGPARASSARWSQVLP